VAQVSTVSAIIIAVSLKIKNTANTKYFLYLSRTKLDMLYQQVARSDGRKHTFEWKLNAGFLSASRTKASQEEIDDDDRLNALIEALDASDEVGTIDEPRSYFRGTMPMKWGMFNDAGRPDGEAPLVYFGGQSRKTIFGLGGSTRHVLGFEGASSTGSRSATPSLVAHLLQSLDIDPTGWRAFGPDRDTREVCEAVAIATYKLKGPVQNLEFVARTLVTGKARHTIFTDDKTRYCVLGTPLYVALMPPYPMGL
jgi:uncharacterized protein DUF7019